MWPFNKPIPEGSPWVDYKELTKTGQELRFQFKIENFLTFVLREMCIQYPCAANGNSQLPLKVTAEVRSTTNLFTPVPIPIELLSSPSQNFRQGALNEEPQGLRRYPVIMNYPFAKGDTLIVSVSGDPVGMLIGCMIAGRKFGGEKCR
jgi:hypothetical protein